MGDPEPREAAATSGTDSTRSHWILPGAIFAVGTVGATLVTLWDWSAATAVGHASLVRDTDLQGRIFQIPAEAGVGGLAHLYQLNGSNLGALQGFQYPLIAALHLAEAFGLSAPGYRNLPHRFTGYPTGSSYGLLLPVAYALGLSTLFPFEALLRRFGAAGWRRPVLTVVAALLLLWIGVWWGHPEYGLMLTGLLGAALLARRERWAGAGWLLGLALVSQSVALVSAPLLLVVAGRRWLRVATRAVVPVLGAVIVPLLGDPAVTWRAISQQPNTGGTAKYHLTPLFSLVAQRAPGARPIAAPVGPVRSLALVAAIVLAVPLARWVCGPRLDLRRLLWAFGALLALRVVFEPVEYPYYLAPSLLCFVGATAMAPLRRLSVLLGGSGVLAWAADLTLGRWPYWVTLTGGLALLAALSYPDRTGRGDLSRPPGAVTPDRRAAAADLPARRAEPVARHPIRPDG